MMLRRLALAGLVALFPALASAQVAFIAPTAPPGDNSDKIANTQWLNQFFASGLPLPSGQIWIGSGGGVAIPQTPSGDWTISNAGAATLATVNANVGTFGSATTCITTTQNAKGLTTAISAATCTPAIGSITGLGTGIATALGINVGTAGAPVLFNGAGGTPSSISLINATGVPAVTSLTPGGGLVSSTTANCSQTSITTTGTVSRGDCVNAQVGTSYAIADTDRGKVITASNAAAQAYSIAQASTAGAFFAGWSTFIENNSINVAGVVTITPATSQICAQGVCAATYKIQPGQFARITSDGANYQVTENPASSQMPGTTTNDNANAGNVGEYVSSTIPPGSAVALATSTSANVTSISLTAGDWDVFGQVFINPAGGTNTTSFMASSSTTSATLASPPDFVIAYSSTGVGIGNPISTKRFSVNTTTTVFLVVFATFTGGTNAAYGTLAARRRR
jgi:hypothetical protein